MINNGTNILWYRRGATYWNEALPLGNGRIGAMVYGGALNERVSLNEDTLWSGYPTYYNNPEAYDAYKEAQALVKQGEYGKAQELIEKKFTSLWSQLYMPLGDMHLYMQERGAVTNYSRALDMSTGVHRVEYEMNGAKYVREMFVSEPDQVMAVRLTCDRPASITFELSLAPSLNAYTSIMPGEISIEGNCPSCICSFFSFWQNVDFVKL